MIGERVSHLSVSSCVPAPHCTRDSTPRSAHGVPPPAVHGAALSAPHGVPPPASHGVPPSAPHYVPPRASHGVPPSVPHGVPPSASHGVPPSAPHGVPPPVAHGASPPAPHCAATPLVWCYLRLTARRISPRCSPRQHGLPRPYSPRRGDTHAVQVAPYQRSAVWCGVVSQRSYFAQIITPIKINAIGGRIISPLLR